ncbi:Sau3AI family type II restriction endonuclease [Apilactobacillus xinyiensis]|uniref:Sau3AI family type II restriction endonuclease n=1 Tax=Apilactobacillus xinyiensis TaxID=2841032 RepID=UPI00200D07F1|nr:Sau3AI family type II restriction endonuclease [Apilactobacillus xinyiensis]MCL0319306.1 DNA mismatch repair protein MutH [Apilactobacillus xinyiensis]
MKFKSKEDVHNRAIKILNKPQKELIEELNMHIKGNKNAMGDVFEKWFGKEKDSASKPDLGVVELKATPFKKLKKTKNGKVQYSAKERLVLNIINYFDLVKEDFEHSHFMSKNNTLEIAFYEYLNNIPKSEWFFKYVIIYQMQKSPVDYEIIKKDWETIQAYVRNGKAEDLNEGLTNYLAACTKGKNHKSLREQPYSTNMAKQRAFSFKASFMTRLLRDYVIGNKKNQAIIKSSSDIQGKTLDQLIYDRLDPFIGKSTNQLKDHFGITNKAKNINNVLARRMLGLKDSKNNINGIDEFEKASIIPKTIQVNSNKKNRESMSLPPFKFKDLVNQTWGNDSCDLYNYLNESKFLFIVFQQMSNGDNIFKGALLHHISENILNNDIMKVWIDTKNKIKQGVELNYKKNGTVSNNFIKLNNQSVIHVRPHAAKSSYIESTNSNQLPTPAKWKNKPSNYSDDYMTTQSFWINNSYILNVIKKLID